MQDIPDLVEDISLRSDIKSVEEARINYRRRPDNDKTRALDCLGVVKFIEAQPGPRLLIVNTVHTAAVIAHKMREIGIDTLHISTALAPIHRDLIVKMVKKKLKSKKTNWTLVATSCVEAGMNFSFQTGLRERSSTASLIQIGGRVSRGDEFEDAVVWDIFLQDDRFRSNPSISIARQVLDRFAVDELNKTHPSELASIAMKMEWNFGAEEKARQIIRLEERMEYPDVSSECKVIDTDTRTVIIDRAFYEALRNGDKISRIELMKHSVQIWANKIEKLSLQPVFPASRSSDSDIYFWQYDYDPEFIGYMEGVLKLESFLEAGGAII
jgi:CRISPR/Cas system-associated endonuclease/helicase Cas3